MSKDLQELRDETITELKALRNELGRVQARLAVMSANASDLDAVNASDLIGKAYGKVSMAWRPVSDAINALELGKGQS